MWQADAGFFTCVPTLAQEPLARLVIYMCHALAAAEYLGPGFSGRHWCQLLQGQQMPFKDRADAGRELAKALARYKDEQPVLLALPRGGVSVAAEVAAVLKAPST
jgi:hypothetical protein